MWMVGSMPDTKVSAAALLAIFNVAMFIEGPVIDLLATATTLGTDLERFKVLRRFTMVLMVWVSVAHGLVAFTPLYKFVMEVLLDTEPAVATAAWPGFAAMTLWSAGVGWRRYLQGMMIRAGQTRAISWGTLLRVVVLGLVGYPLSRGGVLPGLGGIGIALFAAVLAEAVFVHITARRVLASLRTAPTDTPMSLGKVFYFHLPLAASTLLMFLTPSILTRALNETGEGTLAMASWQTAFSFMWLLRTVTFALPEALISRYSDAGRRVLAGFSTGIGTLLSLLTVLVSVTGIDKLVFMAVYSAEAAVADRAAMAFLLCAGLPFGSAVVAYFKAALTANHVTWARAVAIGASFLLTTGGIALGAKSGLLGVQTASLATNAGVFGECVALAICWWLWSRSKGVGDPVEVVEATATSG